MSSAREYRSIMESDQGTASDRASDLQKGNPGPAQQQQRADSVQYSAHHQFAASMMQHGSFGFPSTETTNSMSNYGQMTSGLFEPASYGNFSVPRSTDPNLPTFSSPPNSPLVGLVFDPSSPNYVGPSSSSDGRNLAVDQRTQTSWMGTNPDQILPIGTGARKKIMKTQPDIRCYSADRQTHREMYLNKSDNTTDKKRENNLVSESCSSLDFFAEGERMVSELCNVAEMSSTKDGERNRGSKPYCFLVTKESSQESIETLLNCLDKIVIHDQIPNEIVQLAVEACTDAENIAIAHHNRPCFKNIHSICAKTRSNVQKPDSAVANLHSQGIPWVIKNFIFSFVRILDGWKGVKELLSEKHETFSRIENKYYSPNIRECFFQWQAVTKEMLSHIYKTFKCLDQGFTMEQKSFTHNYYSTNSAAPRHQNQSKFQQTKAGTNAPRPVSVSSQTYGPTGHWLQNSPHAGNQSYTDPPWPSRSTGKKYSVVPSPHSYVYSPGDTTDSDNFHHKPHFKNDPAFLREHKPRQSWTISSMQDFRALENLSNAEQRQLYSHIKQTTDAELGNSSRSTLFDVKSKMIPVSHVEKALIPGLTSGGDGGGTNYVQLKKNSSGDAKEESGIFTEWSRALQRDSSQQMMLHKQNLQALPFPTNVVVGQPADTEIDEFHDQSKVYMKPGSYKVPTKPSDLIHPFPQDGSSEQGSTSDTTSAENTKGSLGPEIAPSTSMYSMESWSCMQSNNNCGFSEVLRQAVAHGDLRGIANDCGSYVPSDRAWEAAKQSAPKLMDFICEGSRSDAARLYDALGSSSIADEYCEEFKRLMNPINRNEGGHTDEVGNNVSRIWNQQEKSNQDSQEENSNYDLQNKEKILDNTSSSKRDESKENPNQSKIDDKFGRNKNLGRPKVAISALWYQPKKHKPISKETSKVFEQIITELSRMNEADFIQNDMDIKSAPRFYEVVKHPVCLTDISTKLRSYSYSSSEQVLQDFRRAFNNVRLYLKTYPDATMKRNVTKVSAEFEKMISEEQKKLEATNQDKIVFNDKGTSKVEEQKKTPSENNNQSDSKKSDE